MEKTVRDQQLVIDDLDTKRLAAQRAIKGEVEAEAEDAGAEGGGGGEGAVAAGS